MRVPGGLSAGVYTVKVNNKIGVFELGMWLKNLLMKTAEGGRRKEIWMD